jgi:hypothetical protein
MSTFQQKITSCTERQGTQFEETEQALGSDMAAMLELSKKKVNKKKQN